MSLRIIYEQQYDILALFDKISVSSKMRGSPLRSVSNNTIFTKD